MSDDVPTTPHSILGRMLQRAPQDEAAWAEFVKRYGAVIHRWCRERQVQETDAEDLAQEVLGRLYRSLRRYDRSKGLFRNYLYRITQNVVNDYFNAKNQDPLTNAATVDAGSGPTQPDTLVERLAKEYDLELLEEARERVRDRVSQQHWEVFRLMVDEGRDAKEVAESLGLGLTTVYRRRKEVVEAIQAELKRLEEHGFDSE